MVSFIILAGCQDSDDNNAADSDETNTDEASTNDESNHSNSDEQQPDEIDGTLWGEESDFGVVMSHGAAYDADSWEDEGQQLADEGMTVFAVEDTDPDTLMAASDMLKEEYGVEQVAVIGASAGGQTAIEALEQEDADFDRVILLSPSGDATEIEDEPVLVIYSEEEGFDDLEDNKGSNIETIAIPGSAHAQELFDDAEKGEQTMDHIINFLEEE